jgi:hypothetical protein
LQGRNYSICCGFQTSPCKAWFQLSNRKQSGKQYYLDQQKVSMNSV